jgi:hypothetical protein
MEATMGHIRLGVLPKYPRWKGVIGLLGNTETPASEVVGVADKALDGVEEMLSSESAQSCVGYCIWLLAQLTLASRGEDFETDVTKLGVQTAEHTSATEFLAKTSRVVTCHLSDLTPHTALNNIAGLALRETLTRTVGVHARTLFGTGLVDVQLALKKYSTHRQFSALLHVYFTAFLRRTLRFIIDKEIANHLGPGNRFEDIQDIKEFEDALEIFASQTSRIVDEFSGGWYSKRAWQQGAISESDTMRFVHVALDKLRADLELNEVQ